ncbi:LVIVD repeat-containing protein [Pyxidicoccus sp. 3LFB2]
MTAGLLALAGCGQTEDEPKPWDGSYTAMEEQGDWVDTGPYAACKVLTPVWARCVPTEETFDMSGCKRSTLGALDREGIYRMTLRYEALDGESWEHYTYSGGGSLRFGEDGQPVTVHGHPVSGTQMDGQTFLAVGNRPENVATQQKAAEFTLSGCEAPTSRVLTGCFTTCISGWLSYAGTFRAERLTWGRAERESSGNLRPLSESRVELGSPVDIYVAKDHAYVVSINRYGKTGGLTVFDVSDRARPVFKTTLTMPGDSYWNGVWAKGDALYVASGDTGLLVFDISNPGAPVFLRNYPGDRNIDVHTVLVDGDRLYAMSPGPNRETLIFDVTTPTTPRLLGRRVMPFSGYPHDAFSFGGRLYLSHMNGGYVVADASDPANVRELGRYWFEGQVAHHSAVGTIGGQTIAFEGGEQRGAHLRVLKVDDPANIVKIGEFKLRDVTSIHNIILKGERLYVAWYQEGVRVLDVSNPTRPRQVAHFNTFRDTDPNSQEGQYEGALGIRVPGDGYVYVVDDVRGLFIFREP